AAFLRDALAAARCGPPRHPGTAGPLALEHDAAVHASRCGAIEGRVQKIASPRARGIVASGFSRTVRAAVASGFSRTSYDAAATGGSTGTFNGAARRPLGNSIPSVLIL